MEEQKSTKVQTLPGHHAHAGDSTEAFVKQVRNYYNASNHAYLEDLGTSFQVALAKSDYEDQDAVRASNLYYAGQAGIKPGDHVLDAGCGVCGPSIDIAGNIDGVTIDAITLSPVQANTARGLIERAGLQGRVRVHVGDFHELPFAGATFDVAIFLESTGYSYDPLKLFSGVYRVLRPGGLLFIKDVFRWEGPLSEQARQDLAEFDRIYAQRTPLMSETAAAVALAGFIDISVRNLGRYDGNAEDPGQVATGHRFYDAMFTQVNGTTLLTEFGKLHAQPFKKLPVYFGELKARKVASDALGVS